MCRADAKLGEHLANLVVVGKRGLNDDDRPLIVGNQPVVTAWYLGETNLQNKRAVDFKQRLTNLGANGIGVSGSALRPTASARTA